MARNGHPGFSRISRKIEKVKVEENLVDILQIAELLEQLFSLPLDRNDIVQLRNIDLPAYIGVACDQLAVADRAYLSGLELYIDEVNAGLEKATDYFVINQQGIRAQPESETPFNQDAEPVHLKRLQAVFSEFRRKLEPIAVEIPRNHLAETIRSNWVRNSLLDGSNLNEYDRIVLGFEQLIKSLEECRSLSNSETIEDTRRRHLVEMAKTLQKLLDAPLIDVDLVETVKDELEQFGDDIKNETKKITAQKFVQAGTFLLGELVKKLIGLS